MHSYKDYLIGEGETFKNALMRLNVLGADAVLFIVNEQEHLLGSLTDGDVRRGLLSGLSVEDSLPQFMHTQPRSIFRSGYSVLQIIEFRKLKYRIIPVLDDSGRVMNVINFNDVRSYLPLDVIIMAGGRGQRLSPETDSIPKPLLPVGGKPIIEYNIDHLINFGIENICISVGYLGQKIEDYFSAHRKTAAISYIHEESPLGTIGAASLAQNLKHEYVLVMNADILTNINFEEFFCEALAAEADLAVVSIPYSVNIPYAVLELEENRVCNLVEKPNYTYFSSGGIYLIKKSVLNLIPKGTFYNATDLIQNLLLLEKKVYSYSMVDYWLDIGKYDDFMKAQDDIHHIKF